MRVIQELHGLGTVEEKSHDRLVEVKRAYDPAILAHLADVARRAQSEAEKRKIEQALKEAGGNKGRASEILLVSYKTFLMKLKDYGIE